MTRATRVRTEASASTRAPAWLPAPATRATAARRASWSVVAAPITAVASTTTTRARGATATGSTPARSASSTVRRGWATRAIDGGNASCSTRTTARRCGRPASATRIRTATRASSPARRASPTRTRIPSANARARASASSPRTGQRSVASATRSAAARPASTATARPRPRRKTLLWPARARPSSSGSVRVCCSARPARASWSRSGGGGKSIGTSGSSRRLCRTRSSKGAPRASTRRRRCAASRRS
mmetsp:Transcript_10063/g.26672  ORF Transcript_10063/g.26672 Transcript_10063/m.26672 type:complete len:245 (-) Transcript_10063:148-882(-)